MTGMDCGYRECLRMACAAGPRPHFFLLFLRNIDYNKLVSWKMKSDIVAYPAEKCKGEHHAKPHSFYSERAGENRPG